MKKLTIGLMALFAMQGSAHALPSNSHHALSATAAALACAGAYYFNWVPKVDSKGEALWLTKETFWFAGLASVATWITWYVAEKYTPEGKFAWAKDVSAKIDSCGLVKQVFNSPQELETFVKKTFIRQKWPVVHAYYMLQGQHNNALDSIAYLNEAKEENSDPFFVGQAQALQDDLREKAAKLSKPLTMIRELPYFYERLHQYEMIQAEFAKARAQRQMACSQSQIAMNSWYR